MSQKVVSLAVLLLSPAFCQTLGSGIESIRVGMTTDAVDLALNHPNARKVADPRDHTLTTWTLTDASGSNTITFKNGRVAAVDAHTSAYSGDAKDAVKKAYALLYDLTRPGSGANERSAPATVVLREYPDVSGGEPIRQIELQIGQQHVDLTIIAPGDNNFAFVGRGLGKAPSPEIK